MTTDQIRFSFDSAADKVKQLKQLARQQATDIKGTIPDTLAKWAMGEVSDEHLDSQFRQIRFWEDIRITLTDNTVATVLNRIACQKATALREAEKKA